MIKVYVKKGTNCRDVVKIRPNQADWCCVQKNWILIGTYYDELDARIAVGNMWDANGSWNNNEPNLKLYAQESSGYRHTDIVEMTLQHEDTRRKDPDWILIGTFDCYDCLDSAYNDFCEENKVWED